MKEFKKIQKLEKQVKGLKKYVQELLEQKEKEAQMRKSQHNYWQKRFDELEKSQKLAKIKDNNRRDRVLRGMSLVALGIDVKEFNISVGKLRKEFKEMTTEELQELGIELKAILD